MFRRAFLTLTALAWVPQVNADYIWHSLGTHSLGSESLSYLDPSSGESALVDFNRFFDFSSTTVMSDPVEVGGDVWRSEEISSSASFTSSFFRTLGESSVSTLGAGGFLTFDPSRTAPDPGAFGLTPASEPAALLPYEAFTLFNTAGLRDSGALPGSTAADEYLLDRTGLGLHDFIESAKMSSELPVEWTALTFAFSQSPQDVYGFTEGYLDELAASEGVDPSGFQGLTPTDVFDEFGLSGYDAATTATLALVVFTTDALPEFVSEPAPGTAENPFLPAGGLCDGFCFPTFVDEPDELLFFDPIYATGYEYEVTGGGEFASVLLPAIGDNLFELLLFDDLIGDFVGSGETLESGTEYFFGDGVTKFRVLGIEVDAMIDPFDPLGFVTGLSFDRAGAFEIIQTALTTTVPEPRTILLTALAATFVLGSGQSRAAGSRAS